MVVLLAALGSDAGARADDAAIVEPELFRSTLRIEPTRRQVGTLPVAAAAWRVAPAVAARLEEVADNLKLPAPLVAALRARMTIAAETGEGVIVPDATLLDLFRRPERARWWAVLAGHTSNRSYRWPVAIRTSVLAQLGRDARFAAAVERIERWGVPLPPRMLFADLFALEGAFADDAARQAFFKQLLSADTEFVKVVADTTDEAEVGARAAYWQVQGRYRAIEPMLNAVGHIEGHDRVDIAHLLPRLARSLLYTYPPDFGSVQEPSTENAALAAAFFAPALDANAALADGFAAWLQANCEPVGEARQYGDIIVFEDPARTRWPFCMIHVADGVVFGRRPTLYGPWELLEQAEIVRLNPRLSGFKPAAYRRKTATDDAGRPIEQGDLRAPRMPAAWRERLALRELPEGPWGRLRCYDVLLAPPLSMLESLPVPERQPTWTFHDTSARDVDDALARIDGAPARRQLGALFDEVGANRRGLITVHPSPELVLATPAAFRQRLFPKLVHGVQAIDYAQDILIPARVGAETWFSAQFLPEDARAVVLGLVYPRGPGLMLSDYGTLYHAIPDTEERLATLRAVFRAPAVILLLERPRPEDVAGLVDYWRIDQQKSIPGLLQSFAANEEVAYLDVVHLVPPLAREFMNTYLLPGVNAATGSCYWTALNFAADRTDSRLMVTPKLKGSQGELAWKELQRAYVRVPRAGMLGDVIAYRRKADGELLHVCTFVAADVVFTKNGFGYSAPWCFMHLADVDAVYGDEGAVERLVFRARETPEPDRE